MPFVITAPCIDILDKSCVSQCPVDCIYEGDRMMYIHPGECVDCGACEPVCPQEAIYYDEEVPEKWKDFGAANAQFFDTLGSPAGAAAIGKQGHDADLVLQVVRRRNESDS
jgi:NAD-dependent dihydropyrimidine dehydrogenase PreA subunit